MPVHAAAARPAVFEVAGLLEPAAAGLRVRVTARNIGGQPAEDLRIEGELMGHHGSTEIPATVVPGGAHDALLAFPRVVPTAGVHALALRFDYESVSSPDVAAAALSQWAYLLLGFGGQTAPGLAIELPAARFAETTTVPVTVRSTDGRAHRVRLSLYVPRGLAVVPHRQTLDVPAAGAAVTPARYYRSLAAPKTAHGVLALAVTEDEEVVGTSAAVSTAEIAADPALVPRLHVLLFLGAGLCVLAAVAAQRRRVTLPAEKDLARPTPTV